MATKTNKAKKKPEKAEKPEKRPKVRRVIIPQTKRVAPRWSKYKKEEVAHLIVDLAEKGMDQAKIGIVLRDRHGIPSVKKATKQSISQILKERHMEKELPEDLLNLIKKAVTIQDHIARNKRDGISKRGLEMVEAKIRSLGKYYRRNGRIPANWRYEPERAKLLVK